MKAAQTDDATHGGTDLSLWGPKNIPFREFFSHCHKDPKSFNGRKKIPSLPPWIEDQSHLLHFPRLVFQVGSETAIPAAACCCSWLDSCLCFPLALWRKEEGEKNCDWLSMKMCFDTLKNLGKIEREKVNEWVLFNTNQSVVYIPDTSLKQAWNCMKISFFLMQFPTHWNAVMVCGNSFRLYAAKRQN